MAVQRNRLLILSCSQRKCLRNGLLPAIERYDGPSFRLLRKFLENYSSQKSLLDIYILSAKFGLIPANRKIPNYDMKMTPEGASELGSQVLSKLRKILRNTQYNELFINVGKIYLLALNGYDQFIPSNTKVTFSLGSQGLKLSKLYDWLHKRPPPMPIHTRSRSVRLKGIDIKLTPDQILTFGRQALANGLGIPDLYQSWYVMIDNRQVSPKWLLSQLTGLSVHSFHTSSARRILQQLGVEVRRI